MTVTNTSVNAAAFFAGIRARNPQSDGSSRCSVDRACVATNPCGVIQMALPTTIIRNPTLMQVREETLMRPSGGMILPRITGDSTNGSRMTNDMGSGAVKIVQAMVMTNGRAIMTMIVSRDILTRSTPSIRFMLSQM